MFLQKAMNCLNTHILFDEKENIMITLSLSYNLDKERVHDCC